MATSSAALLTLASYAFGVVGVVVVTQGAVQTPDPLPLAQARPMATAEVSDLIRQARKTGKGKPAGESPELVHWALGRLTAWGYVAVRQEVPLESGPMPRRAINVLGIYPGRSDGVVLIVAPLGGESADSARATAAALAAAHALAQPRAMTLAILLEGADQFSHEGSRVFTRVYSGIGRVVASLGIGPIPTDPAAIRILSTGQPNGHAPMWLRGTALAIAESEGLDVSDSIGYNDWTALALGRSRGPEGPLLAAGVPSITYESAQGGYASPDGSLKSIDPPARMASAADRFARTFDRTDLPPQEPMTAISITSDHIVPMGRLRSAGWIAFAPLWMAGILRLRRDGREPGMLRRATVAFGVRILPLVVGAAALLTLPRFAGWPHVAPTPGLLATLPPLGPLALVGACAVAVWIALAPIRKVLAKAGPDVTSPAELPALSLAVAFGILAAPAVAPALLPAAWFWPLARQGRNAALFLLLGCTGIIALIGGAAHQTGMWWRFLPYVLEVVATGGWSFPAVLAGILLIGVAAGAAARSFR